MQNEMRYLKVGLFSTVVTAHNLNNFISTISYSICLFSINIPFHIYSILLHISTLLRSIFVVI